jgi:DNA mismatch repair ATPase MutS
MSAQDGFLADLVNSVFMIDLITFESLKNKVWQNRDDIFVIHEQLGQLDTAIAVASYQKSLKVSCVPALDFSQDKAAFIRAAGMAHPLLSAPVPNDLNESGPVLITGSNASGKSTYIKTAALCAILAQTIGVVPAASYRASAFRIYSSMAISDDLAAGESYYIAEIRSLKRILDAADRGDRVFTVIDEVLRGTNTIERISASAEILTALYGRGVLCVAATHDIELCSLLDGKFTSAHFEEQVGETDMSFDYKVKPGPAVSRNAINLLKLMGFDEAIVARAHRRANAYTDTGVWTAGSLEESSDVEVPK